MNNINIIFWVLIFSLGIAIGVSVLIFKYVSLLKDNAVNDQKIKNLNDNISNQTKISDILKIEFENIAAKILEEKKTKLSDLSKTSLEDIVIPFKEKMEEFKNKMECLQLYETEKISGLQKELEKLVNLNKQVSEEANNLAVALKGENKLQGMWGEINLERIFEYVGMMEGINYISQKRIKTENGEKIPDYIVNLPDKKHIVIDAKTSLIAYERYYSARSDSDKKIYLKEHFLSVKRHIDELAGKDYNKLENLNHPEYVLMFVPIEGAISLASAYKSDIVSYAFMKDIIIVTPSTLLATLKTIEYMWRQTDQKKNVLEIAKQGGYLYDKFVAFVQTLTDADKKITEAKNKTQEALKRLSFSDKKGDSLIERAQKLKELGILSKKNINEEIKVIE
ncbi:MAG: DNA recombination protein RmuC [Endomicrobium sp.]|jgi:DNA recombination protein RmuC|nr:DNA recombination protein RmuC [Endomicrobium sp.]